MTELLNQNLTLIILIIDKQMKFDIQIQLWTLIQYTFSCFVNWFIQIRQWTCIFNDWIAIE